MLICRMVVHPDYFRQGIADALLHALQLQGDWEKISVSEPACTEPLRKNGFTHKEDIEASPHFFHKHIREKAFILCKSR
ncbi:GNAT family N-acetyltransferase [Peribacillus simplex]|uniref:GNAT family N-acetyltransferase n=1 Tax=Peribacillus simplex TaxID=1478 RepID=UPI0037C89CBB